MWLDFRLLLTAYLCNIINGAKLLSLKDIKIEPNDDSTSDYLKNMKRVLVKRIVPHGYETKDLEYDNKFKTYYRPIARYHKGKPVNIPIISDDEPSDDEVTNDEVIKFLETHYDTLKKRNVENDSRQLRKALQLLLRIRQLSNTPVDRSRGENGLIMKLYRKYKDVVFSLLDEQFGGESGKKKEFLERAIKQIKKFNDKKDLFFTLSKAFTSFKSLREKNEDVKEMEFFNPDDIVQTEKPKVKLPYVPFWNYWTYEKSMHVDNCKNGWVRFHDMCMQLPPRD